MRHRLRNLGRPVAVASIGLAACAPALDWREFTPEGVALTVSFPCRPDRHARPVVLAGAKAPMEMLVCEAAGQTFALSFVDVASPARTGVALEELRAVAVANVQGAAPSIEPAEVKGMTPNPQALRLRVQGRLPDGAAVQEHAVFFTRGLRIYQATVIGAQPTREATETFFSALRFPA